MIPERPIIERRILSALDATPARIPVLLGACGSGRTTLLHRVATLLGDGHSQYLDAERAVSTPEGFLGAILSSSPYLPRDEAVSTESRATRAAVDALLRFFRRARSQDAHVPTFLIDEVLEFRAFENFPGLRGVLRELVTTLTESENRFVLSTRYVSRAHRLLRDAPERFEVIHVPPLSAPEVADALGRQQVGRDDAERTELGRIVHALTDGRPAYVRALAEALATMGGAGAWDPVSALAAQLSVGAPLSQICRFCYELRLHRARGYGALKAILQVLAEEEPLTLTEIAQRLGRTPGSTKDYLSWLQDVDLLCVRQKRYSFGDPVLRLWVRLHCRPTPPDDADLAREAQEHAVVRLPYMERTLAMADTPATSGEIREDKTLSMIEID